MQNQRRVKRCCPNTLKGNSHFCKDPNQNFVFSAEKSLKMACHRASKSWVLESSKEKASRALSLPINGRHVSPISSISVKMYRNLLLLSAILLIGLVMLLLSPSMSRSQFRMVPHRGKRYLYWGKAIDCPGKHCLACEGLGHQESSLRCALEEAMFLQRIFVMPSHMCINRIHNDKGILSRPNTSAATERWASNYCTMDSLYDLELISKTVPVILDSSEEWHNVVSKAKKSRKKGLIHVQGVDRKQLKENLFYNEAWIINRTASPLSWFVECKDRNNHSAVMLPYTFLPKMASKRLHDTAEQIKNVLGNYDAMHVRRGDKIKIRADRFGVNRTLHPHLDRDTRPEAIMRRIAGWIPKGRTIFIASNERSPGFFSPLAMKYKLAYSSNFTNILDNVVENNYQLFMLERLILYGAETFVKTFKEEESDLSLSDDPKKNLKGWQIPVYTFGEEVSDNGH